MNCILMVGLVIGFLALLAAGWLGWQLLRQIGRILLRIEALEKRIEEMQQEPGDYQSLPRSFLSEGPLCASARSERAGSADASDDERAERFSNRSLANSKIKRDGLKAGTVAPEFRLPRLNGGELSLFDLRGRKVLLVFSSPHCGPCNVLAPKLQKFYRRQNKKRFFRFLRKRTQTPPIEIVMIIKGEPEENRGKVKEHGLTFPVVLQKQWEVSRPYAFFGTPVGYLIDETGILIADAAIGVDGIVDLMNGAKGIVANGESRKQKVEIQNPTESSETESLLV